MITNAGGKTIKSKLKSGSCFFNNLSLWSPFQSLQSVLSSFYKNITFFRNQYLLN